MYNINFEEKVVYFGEGNQEPVRITFEELRRIENEIRNEDMKENNIGNITFKR